MNEVAGWIAPIATTVAACMTAANLGARTTGWGFVVFTIGSIAWATIGLSTGQGNLVWQNAVLTLINLIGVWRWLGREAGYQAGAAHAAEGSRAAAAPDLFACGAVPGRSLIGADGTVVGEAVEIMAEGRSGRIGYLVCREGGVAGVGERLHAIDWAKVTPGPDGFSVALTAEELQALPVLDAQSWPARREELAA